MAKKNRIGLQFDGWKEYMEKLDRLAGSSGMKRAVESALSASKQYVNQKIIEALQPGNLPAKGIYSGGRVLNTLNQDMTVSWNGDTAEIKVGWNLKEDGLTSIFLMYGTPRMSPVKGLKAAIYGTATKKEVAEIQQEAIQKVMERLS